MNKCISLITILQEVVRISLWLWPLIRKLLFTNISIVIDRVYIKFNKAVTFKLVRNPPEKVLVLLARKLQPGAPEAGEQEEQLPLTF